MSYKIIKDPEGSEVYYREKIQLLMSHCPQIYPCCKCGHPVVTGYICGTCKDGSPYEK